MDFIDVKGVNVKVHPDVDKQAWTSSKVIKGKEEGLPTLTKLDAVRYRYTSKDEGDLPFRVNVFNSKKAGFNLITIEVEYN
jgi:hypothetical protein